MARPQVYRGNPELKQTVLFDNFSGGMNTTVIDDQVMTNEFRLLQNVELEKQGRLQKRKGFGEEYNFTEQYYPEKVYYLNYNAQDLSYDIIYYEDGKIYWMYRTPKRGNISGNVIRKEMYHVTDITKLKEPKVTGINVVNYNSVDYFMLSEIIEGSEALVKFSKFESFLNGEDLQENWNNFKIYNKANSFKPNPYDISINGEGFNLFSNNPHMYVDISDTSTKSITGIILIDKEDSEKILYKIPRGGDFKVMVYYTGDLLPEMLTLDFYTYDDEQEKEILKGVSYEYDNTSSELGYFIYNVTLDRITTSEIMLDVYYEIINKADSSGAIEIPGVTDLAGLAKHFREDVDEEFNVYNSEAGTLTTYKKQTGTPYRYNTTTKQVFRDGFERYSNSSNYRFKDSNLSRFNISDRTSNEPEQDIYYYDSGVKIRKGKLAKGQIDDISSPNPTYKRVVSRSKINSNLIMKTHKTQNVPLTSETIGLWGQEWFILKNSDDTPKYYVQWLNDDYGTNLSCNADTVGMSFQHVSANTDRGYHGLEYEGTKVSKTNIFGKPKEYETTFSPIITDCVLQQNYSKWDYNAYAVKSQVTDVNLTADEDLPKNILRMESTFKINSSYYVWKGVVEGNTGSSSDFELIDEDITERVITHTITIKVSDKSGAEYEEIKPFNFTNTKFIVIQERLVLFNENTIWWSSMYSDLKDSAGNEQDFTYFPNNNWVSIPLSTNDSIQAIRYYRGSYMIFTRDSIYRMSGQLGGPDFEVVLVNDSIGCIAPDTIRSFNNTLQFLSKDGLYIMKQNYYMDGMENVEKIDKNISDLIPRTNNHESLMFNEQYWLIVKNENNEIDYVIKQYYNLDAVRKSFPFTVDKYGYKPINLLKTDAGVMATVSGATEIEVDLLDSPTIENNTETTYYYTEGIELNKFEIEEKLKITVKPVGIPTPFEVRNSNDIYWNSMGYIEYIGGWQGQTSGSIILKFYEDRLVVNTNDSTVRIQFETTGAKFGLTPIKFYKYGTGYLDFDFNYDTIIETPNWSFGHPLHEKKYKNIFLNIESENRMPVYFTIEVDKSKTNEENVYELKVNRDGELEYEVSRNPKYMLETTGRFILDEGLLNFDRLGESGYQVHKIIASDKGRYIKLRFHIFEGDNFAIDSINFVYKLGKMRERR